jgi:hypothetical protein
MPPQQAYGLLDVVDYVHDLIAHVADTSLSLKKLALRVYLKTSDGSTRRRVSK